MSSSGRVSDREMGVFSRGLTRHLRSELEKKGHEFEVRKARIDTSTRQVDNFIIGWSYNDKHGGQIMVARSREEEDSLTVNHFWGVKSYPPNTRDLVSSPIELRAAAQIHEDVGVILKEHLGDPVGDHDGRTIYSAPLEQEAEV